MSGGIVPADDLPANLVPASDLPEAPKAQAAKPGVSFGDVARIAFNVSPPGQALGLVRALDKAGYEVGGRMTDELAPYVPPEVAAAAGTAGNLLVSQGPMLVGGGAAGAKTAPAFLRAGEELMQSALKPSKTELATGAGQRAVKTLLNEGANVTPGGVRKLTAEINTLNEAIKEAIKNSPAVVDKAAAIKQLDQVRDKFMMQVNPQSDLAAIQKALEDYLTNPAIAKVSDIPVQLAQQLKQGTYRVLAGKYGEMGSASTEAQKALARGLKEEIAAKVPEISQLNARETELINARDIAQNRVLVDANKNPMGLGWLAAHPSTWLGFAADRSPLIKSLLARTLYSGAESIPANLGAAVGAGTGAVLGIPAPQQRQVQQDPIDPRVQRLPGRDTGGYGMVAPRG